MSTLLFFCVNSHIKFTTQYKKIYICLCISYTIETPPKLYSTTAHIYILTNKVHISMYKKKMKKRCDLSNSHTKHNQPRHQKHTTTRKFLAHGLCHILSMASMCACPLYVASTIYICFIILHHIHFRSPFRNALVCVSYARVVEIYRWKCDWPYWIVSQNTRRGYSIIVCLRYWPRCTYFCLHVSLLCSVCCCGLFI